MADTAGTSTTPPVAWIDFEEHRRKRDYLLALGFFLVAMLCKITMAPFFVIVLLYAWWKRGRVEWRDFKASGAFFVISLMLGGIAVFSNLWYRQFHHMSSALDVASIGGFFPRLSLSGLSLFFYFSK